MPGDTLLWTVTLIVALVCLGRAWGLRPPFCPDRPPDAGDELWSLVVLVRDAAPFIEGFVEDLAAMASGKPIVVVDHGSSDDTAFILRRLRDRLPGLHILRWQPTRAEGPGPLEAALFLTGTPLAVAIDLTNPGGRRWRDLRTTLIRFLQAAAISRKTMTE